MSRTLYEMKEIKSSDLVIPRELYQREEKKQKVAQIVANFDERIANEPKVSFRDNQFFVFDGQHTILAREQLEGMNATILCKVYKNLTAQDEAHLFAMQTGTSSKPRSGSILRAKLFSGNEEAVTFFKATEEVGIAVNLCGNRYDGHLACINTALREYCKLGEERYKEAMSVLYEAWCGFSDSLRHEIVKAVCEFVLLYHDEYNRQRLVNQLAMTDPMEIIRRIHADMKTPNEKKYLCRIYEIYNQGAEKMKLKKKF